MKITYKGQSANTPSGPFQKQPSEFTTALKRDISGSGPIDAKVIFLTDFGDENDRASGQPLSGYIGRLFNNALKRAGIRRSQVRVESVVEEFYSGLRTPYQLGRDRVALWRADAVERLQQYTNANLIVPLGDLALSVVTGESSSDKWHLSLMSPSRGLLNFPKAMPILHPRRIVRNPPDQVFFDLGMQKIAEEAESPELNLPERTFHTFPTCSQVLEFLERMKSEEWLSVDIETGRGQITCLGLGPSPYEAMCIPTLPGCYPDEDLYAIWCALAEVLESPTSKKILQNFIYDATYLSSYGIRLRNVAHDTMFAQKFLYPELKSGLDTIARMHTREPYWKDDAKDWGHKQDVSALYEYNCLMKGSLVLTDCGTLKIEDIVNKRLPVKVVSYNEATNAMEWQPVIGWIKNNTKKAIEWHQIIPAHEPNGRGIIVTQDHKIYTQRGWIRADEVTTQDCVMVDAPYVDAGALTGTLLGDSSFGYTSNSGKAYMQCSQINEELIKLKCKVFGGTYSAKLREAGDGYATKATMMHSAYIPATNQIRRLSDLIVREGKKTLSDAVLEKLTSFGIALWFMDDGYQNKGKSPVAMLAVQGYSKTCQRRAATFFTARYNAKVSVTTQGSLRFSVPASRALCAELGPYIVPTLRYKLPYAAGAYADTLITHRPTQMSFVQVILSSSYTSKHVARGYKKTNYCLTVAGNHNFMTTYGLVANCRDVAVTFEAAVTQQADLKERGLDQLFYDYIMKLAGPVTEMCWRGLPIDENVRSELQLTHERKLKDATDEFDKYCHERLERTVNPQSPKQLKDAFQEMRFKLPTKDGKATTDAKALTKLRKKYPSEPIFDHLLQIRRANKLLGSYIKIKYAQDQRLRFSLRGTGTETLRFAGGKDPWDNGLNPQTVPKEMRKMFVASPGHTLVQVDLAQAESRYVAWRGPVPQLMEFLTTGRDVHKYVSSIIFKKPEEDIEYLERQLGKKSGHGANYGVGDKTFADQILQEFNMVVSEFEAHQMIEGYFTAFPEVRTAYQASVREQVRNTRKLQTVFGWERYFYGRMDDNLFREAYAFEPQSTIPYITNCLMLYMFGKAPMLLQVHDSLLFECPNQDVDALCADMRRQDIWHPEINLPGGKLVIPIDIEVGSDWLNMESVGE